MNKLTLILVICGIGLTSAVCWGSWVEGGGFSLKAPDLFKQDLPPVFLQGDDETQSSTVIKGISSRYGWEIEIKEDGKGTIKIGDELWDIEYTSKSLALNGFVQMLDFIGRKDDNFILVYIELNHVGDEFLIWVYDYKAASELGATAKGHYDLSAASFIENPQPTYMEGYFPKGKVPDYKGVNFRIDSSHVTMTPEGGRLSYHEQGENLELLLWPVYDVHVSSSWEEIWTIGIDPETNHSYLMIFYTPAHSDPSTWDETLAWVTDLWSTEKKALPLGAVEILGGEVYAVHDVELPLR